ncbi:MAG: sensor histidine kinase [Armatimonadota bacterium]
MMSSNRLERLFLYHLWACVPFALAWMLWPGLLGVSRDPAEIQALRVIAALAVAYIALRSWVVLRAAGPTWHCVWPLADVALISVALLQKAAPERSWLSLLYLFPVTQAAATLNLRWALGVGGLAAVAYLAATGAAGLESVRYVYATFRLFFLVLMASLLTHLAREAARAREEVAIARYRSELSREMHDGIQHYLVVIATRLDFAGKLAARDPMQAVRLAVDQRFVVRQAADELRYLIRRLRSPVLERHGFVEGLSEHLKLFDERTSLDVSMQVEGAPHPLSPDVEHAAFRIVQEALTNAEKHARATAISVRLRFVPGRLECRVCDDGVGFHPAAAEGGPSLEGGVGLTSMRERAASVAGTLRVESAAREGTTITLIVPTIRPTAQSVPARRDARC